jgi:hypothetical protein
MVVKFHCLLLIISIIYSVSSRNIQWPNDNQNVQLTTTAAPERVHLNINEHGYSAEDEYKYINECVEKCLQQSNKKSFGDGRDNCIQTQCRVYQ